MHNSLQNAECVLLNQLLYNKVICKFDAELYNSSETPVFKAHVQQFD
jgi:hypothetical protein